MYSLLNANWTSFWRNTWFAYVNANGPVSRYDLSVCVYYNVRGKRCKLHYTFYILDGIKCNGSDTLKVVVGEEISYACSFKYQGIMSPHGGNVKWRDSNGAILEQKEHMLSKVLVSGTCYAGESTHTVHSNAQHNTSVKFFEWQAELLSDILDTPPRKNP